jgi:hypothetical protein
MLLRDGRPSDNHRMSVEFHLLAHKVLRYSTIPPPPPGPVVQVETDLDTEGRALLEICSVDVIHHGWHIPVEPALAFTYTSNVPTAYDPFGVEEDNHLVSAPSCYMGFCGSMG